MHCLKGMKSDKTMTKTVILHQNLFLISEELTMQKKVKICKAEFLLMKKMSNFRFFENYLKSLLQILLISCLQVKLTTVN